jgi:hypothetical protein
VTTENIRKISIFLIFTLKIQKNLDISGNSQHQKVSTPNKMRFVPGRRALVLRSVPGRNRLALRFVPGRHRLVLRFVPGRHVLVQTITRNFWEK